MNKEDQEYWRQLFDSYKESSVQFDKNILFIASGALGISMTFITDLVQLNVANEKWLLTVSWIILTLVILSSLSSHYFSMKAINHRMKNLKSNEDKKSSKYNSLVSNLNVLMIISLTLGILALVLFITLNI